LWTYAQDSLYFSKMLPGDTEISIPKQRSSTFFAYKKLLSNITSFALDETAWTMRRVWKWMMSWSSSMYWRVVCMSARNRSM
jgi:hypothetical protein